MVVSSQHAYQQFVEKFPNLCAAGMVSADYCRFFKVDFRLSRRELIDAHAEFVACCDWLAGCRFEEYATHFSPGTDRLLARVNKTYGRSIPLGALVAAVLYLELPHLIPGNTPGLAVGISRFCPRLYAVD